MALRGPNQLRIGALALTLSRNPHKRSVDAIDSPRPQKRRQASVLKRNEIQFATSIRPESLCKRKTWTFYKYMGFCSCFGYLGWLFVWRTVRQGKEKYRAQTNRQTNWQTMCSYLATCSNNKNTHAITQTMLQTAFCCRSVASLACFRPIDRPMSCTQHDHHFSVGRDSVEEPLHWKVNIVLALTAYVQGSIVQGFMNVRSNAQR